MPDKIELHLTVSATNHCNRGCKHCCTGADSNNIQNFSKKMARTLLDSAEDIASRISVTITGGGEPFLHPELVNLTEIFARHRKVYRIQLVTSGFLPQDKIERQKFDRLIQKPLANKLKFTLSFNDFNPTLHERFKNTLGLILKTKTMHRASVLMCVSQENVGKTIDDLYGVLCDVEISSGISVTDFLVNPFGLRYKDNLPIFASKKEYTEDRYDYLRCESYLLDTYYLAESRKYGLKMLSLAPSSFAKKGKGKNLKDSPLCLSGCHVLLKELANWEGVVSLSVDASGFLYPSCNCEEDKNMRLGRIGEPLDRIIRRKKRIADQMMRLMIADKSKKDRDKYDHCDWCKKLKVAHNL